MYRNTLFLCIICIFTVICSPSLGAGADKKTPVDGKNIFELTDIYRLALKRSESIRISEEDLYIAKKYKEKAFSVLVPRLSTFAGITQFSEEKYASDSLIQPDRAGSWGLTVNQSFTLNGKELIAFKMAEKNIQKFEHALYAEKESYLYQMAAYFYRVIKAKAAVEIADANVKRLRKHRDSVRSRLALEDVPKTDLFRAEAELSKSQTDRIEAKNLERLAISTLGTALGMSETFDVGVPKFSDAGVHFDNPMALKQEALTNRAEIKSVQMDKEISADQIRLTRGNYWPTVSLEGKYVRNDQDPSSSFANEEALSVGLQLNFLIYDGGLRNADLKETLAKDRQVGLAQKALEKKILIEVEQAYLEFATQKSVLNSSKDQLRFARENFEAVTQQFEHGLANSVDVMDANTLLTTSEKQLSDARYSYQLSVLGIKRATGDFLSTILEGLSLGNGD